MYCVRCCNVFCLYDWINLNIEGLTIYLLLNDKSSESSTSSLISDADIPTDDAQLCTFFQLLSSTKYKVYHDVFRASVTKNSHVTLVTQLSHFRLERFALNAGTWKGE